MIIRKKDDNTRASTIAMAKSLKSLLNDGIFSIVLIGTEEINDLFAADAELAGRMKDPIDFGRFRIDVQEEREYFFGFVGELDSQMAKLGVIDKEIGLIDTVRSRAIVYDFADGVIGSVSRILDTALDRALDYDRGAIKWEDISESIRARNAAAMRKGDEAPTYFDAFREGPKRETLAVLNEEEKQLSAEENTSVHEKKRKKRS